MDIIKTKKKKINGNRCIVSSCKASKRSIGLGKIRLFRFPNDRRLPLWMSACKTVGKNPKVLRVCNRHFDGKYFLTKKLRRDAIPTLLLAECSTPVEAEIKTKDVKANEHVISKYRLHCTICDIHIGCAPASQALLRMHPGLRVSICLKCYEFYNKIEFAKHPEREIYCRWCGHEGEGYSCSECQMKFCKKCIENNNFGCIKNRKNWQCFYCSPKSLSSLREKHKAHVNYIKKRSKEILESNTDQDTILDIMCADPSICCKDKLLSTNTSTSISFIQSAKTMPNKKMKLTEGNPGAVKPDVRQALKLHLKRELINRSSSNIDDNVATIKTRQHVAEDSITTPLCKESKPHSLESVCDVLHKNDPPLQLLTLKKQTEYITNLTQSNDRLKGHVLAAKEVCHQIILKLNTLETSDAFKTIKSFNDVKNLQYHLSFLHTYTIGRFKALQDECNEEIQKLNILEVEEEVEKSNPKHITIECSIKPISYNQTNIKIEPNIDQPIKQLFPTTETTLSGIQIEEHMKTSDLYHTNIKIEPEIDEPTVQNDEENLVITSDSPSQIQIAPALSHPQSDGTSIQKGISFELGITMDRKQTYSSNGDTQDEQFLEKNVIYSDHNEAGFFENSISEEEQITNIKEELYFEIGEYSSLEIKKEIADQTYI